MNKKTLNRKGWRLPAKKSGVEPQRTELGKVPLQTAGCGMGSAIRDVLRTENDPHFPAKKIAA